MPKINTYISLLIVAATSVALQSCLRNDIYRSSDGAVWNTSFHISYRSPHALDDSIHAVMKRVEMSLSPFNPASTVSRINRGETSRVDADFIAVFDIASRLSRHSHGAFDPTAAPLINLWGFGYTDTDGNPTQAQIDSAMVSVGIGECRIEGDSLIRKSPSTTFNFSAVAKGYGCDEIARMLRRNGCDDYMVEIGGEIALAGQNSHGKSWNIMIDAPVENLEGEHTRMAVISATDCGIATSGNYRNYRDTSRGRIGHTINPVTGYPAETSTLSATVIAPDCTRADAIATACMALPAAEALEMVENMTGVECLLVTSGDGNSRSFVTSSQFPQL